MPVIRLGAVLISLAVAVVICMVIVAPVGPPSKQELFEKAGLVGKRELLIGVKEDQPGLEVWDPRTRQLVGFDVEIAYIIATDLGFRRSEIRFLAIESEDRAKMQARDKDNGFVTVDLVIASYSITKEREELPLVSFSAPYLFTEQS
jgi:glutamate transport system substrate-binding protein